MKRFLFGKLLILFIILMASCKEKRADPKLSLKKNESNKHINKPFYQIDSTSFLKDYKDGIQTDKTLLRGDEKIHLLHGITSENYILPSDYIFDEDTSKKKLIYLTKTSLLFSSDRIDIGKREVNAVLNEDDQQLKDLAVLLLTPDQTKIENDTLKLSYSYSIPYTDLGRQINISLSLKDKKIFIITN